MKTKEFNNIIQNIPYKEVSSGLYEEIELLCGIYLVIFALDCDIDVKYHHLATRYNPEEYEVKETKEISNIKVFSDDYENEYQINDVQAEKLAQEIEDNLKVIY